MQSRGRGDIVMVLIEGHEVQVTKDQQRAALASVSLRERTYQSQWCQEADFGQMCAIECHMLE